MRKIAIAASTISLLGIVVTIIVNIIARSCFNSPISWSFELTSVLIIWSVYLVFGVNYHDSNHFKIDILKENLNKKITKYFDIVSDIVVMTTIGIIIVTSVSAIKINISMKTMAMGLPVALAFYLPVLLGSTSMAFYILSKYIKLIRAKFKL